jgi:putative methionine-R-sulfoxide reductase with GAF domain
MSGLEGKDFFDNIRRTVATSHFVASIIPLSLLVYFSIKYVYPYVSEGDITKAPLNIGILLLLAVAVSVLGLVLSTRATNSSIASAQNLNTKLNSLFNITKQFRTTLYPDVLLENIMNSAMELTAAESGSLFLYDDHGRLQLKINTGNNLTNTNNSLSTYGENVAAMVAETGKPVLINDPSDYIRNTAGSHNKMDRKTGSLICVPLICSNQTIGVIEMQSMKDKVFTLQDKALLHSLADQASISISQNRSNEIQLSDFIHITEILIGAQDYMQNKKGHARRVASYANQIAKHLNLSDAELKRLYHASLLNDIGMLKIDSSEHCRRDKIIHHPKFGYDLIKSVSHWNDSADIILQHHERFDGSGYPSSKKEEEIPLCSRILFVADTFDVLTSKYSYKQQMDYDSTIREIEVNSGTQFDPVVVKTLKSCITDSDLVRN